MHKTFGYARVAVVSPTVTVGDPEANYDEITKILGRGYLPSACKDADVIVLTELGITGYTCGDLFKQQILLNEAEKYVGLLSSTLNPNQLIFVGAPVRVNGILYNCAIVIHNRTIIGIVPKRFIPTYNEFYERRWFAPATGNEPETVDYAGIKNIPFGIDLLFREKNNPELVVFCEICEDLWMPIPPSSFAAIAGATLLVNLSASNETVAKDEYRSELVCNQSGRCIAAYAYASAGPSESTTDLVFGGHCLIAENGRKIAETSHIGDGRYSLGEPIERIAIVDIDFQKLSYDRQVQTTFADQQYALGRQYRTIDWAADFGVKAEEKHDKLMRHINAYPFIPNDPDNLKERCAAIFDILCAGLVKRLKSAKVKEVTIGVSGGLDSTLALLVTCKAVKILGLPLTAIKAYTMPGFGTTAKTKSIALSLMEQLGVTATTIDIRPTCLQMFKDGGHKPFGIDVVNRAGSIDDFEKLLQEVPSEKRHDLEFENTQARVRTSFLMNKGFVIGTGDLSELALSWCTFNGDHMSMYNPNCSIPKTLVKFLVKYVAENMSSAEVRETLLKCVALIISPELLPPGKDGEIEQSTEDHIGPYVLHDFFIWNIIRCGYSPEKTLFLAEQTFNNPVNGKVAIFDSEKIKNTLVIFIKRFFAGQFKRDCVPGGPKVGSIDLSPRGSWRGVADASASLWLKNIGN